MCINFLFADDRVRAATEFDPSSNTGFYMPPSLASRFSHLLGSAFRSKGNFIYVTKITCGPLFF